MFTGIIEDMGEVKALKNDGGNLHLTLSCSFVHELKIDQSLAHNGVCLTVINIEGNTYTVTAINETLEKTSLSSLKIGDQVNLERALKLGDRLDGHIVQGHVDQVGHCTNVKEVDGSWVYDFEYTPEDRNITIPKGSITINGVSLTVVESNASDFSVAIIPYTFEHTNFKYLKKGSLVNLEFDVIGKYITRIQGLNQN